ncbi:hypothetical protein MK489_07925 [Myxococcota bacterium]|nr:hypothetical protein [Myxococcota bacterium]
MHSLGSNPYSRPSLMRGGIGQTMTERARAIRTWLAAHSFPTLSTPRRRAHRLSFVAAWAGILIASASAGAQEHQFWVGFDVDRDASTGCNLNGGDESGDATVSGFEWAAAIRVDPNEGAPQVTSVAGSSCDAGDTVSSETWGPWSEDFSTGWPVGVDLDGVIGDVIELRVETSTLSLQGRVRLAVLSESAGGHRDTLVTKNGSSGGADILFPSNAVVPALTSPSLVVLALAIAVLAARWIRHPIPGSPAWIALFALGTARAVWALTFSLDGQVDDWAGVPVLATDLSEDSETNDPSADLLTLFAAWDDGDIAIRIDASDLGLDLCDHSGTVCHYVETEEEGGSDSLGTGSSSAPWATLANAVDNLAEGDRVIVRSGTYQETDRIFIQEEDVHVVAEDGVVLHNTIEDFTETNQDSWVVHDEDASVYRSAVAYDATGEERAWGYFLTDESDPESALMLLSYDCYEALAADHSDYPEDDQNFNCDELPNIGPGMYWDVDGDVTEDADGGALDAGHLFVRMTTNSPQFEAVADSNGWDIDEDPNLTVMKITVDGPFLQLNGSNVQVSNLTLELGSLRMGGGTSGNVLREITLDGPAVESPIEFYSGGSQHLLDSLTIDQKFPEYVTWKDTKVLFKSALMYAAITLNDHDEASGYPDAIHHITLQDSILKDTHDGLELNQDAYHHVYIHGNQFLGAQDDAIQLGSSTYDVEISGNTFVEVGTSTSRHGVGGNDYPGRKYIHHNFIDVSTPKYYCRDTEGETSCWDEGPQTMRAFGLHDGEGWEADGDARYIYNNTVVMDGDILGVGLHGQEYQDHCSGGGFHHVSGDHACDIEASDPDDVCNGICVRGKDVSVSCEADDDCDSSAGSGDGVCSSGAVCTTRSLPYGQPSLIFNNVFVQLDETTQFTTQSPKWAILAPATLILDGNYYYRPPGGSSSEGPFEMSGSRCEFDLYRDELCIEVTSTHPEGWDPQITPEWEYTGYTAAYDWGIEDQGLFDDSDLDTDTYIPNCEWLSEQVDPDSGEVIEAVDLTALDGAYTLSKVDPNTGAETEVWSLSVVPELPGVDGSYRGDTPCSDSEEE